MRRSQAAVAVKHEHAEVKAEAVGLAVKADFPPDEAEAMPDALTGLAATPCAAEPKGSEAIVPTPFPGFARPQPQECTVKEVVFCYRRHQLYRCTPSQQLG